MQLIDFNLRLTPLEIGALVKAMRYNDTGIQHDRYQSDTMKGLRVKVEHAELCRQQQEPDDASD